MRNFRVTERDKLPLVVPQEPGPPFIPTDMERRLIWRIVTLNAENDLLRNRLRVAHERLGWSL